MSQDYSDDVFGTTQQVQANMQQIEDNFAALKSAFSGASAPPDPVAGMWWLDTTTHLLKIRNEANSAWQSVWNLASNKPVIANLSGEITGAMIATEIKDAAAGTASLRTLGTAATSACAGNDSRLSDTRTPTDGTVTEGKLGASAVTQAKLKTSSGEVSTAVAAQLTLPGGQYGFYPQVKNIEGAQIFAYLSLGATTSYAAVIYFNEPTAGSNCAQQRYVTSSGEVFWIFFLQDKATGRMLCSWAAPDHPCMGNGGKPLVVPHPFGNYRADLHNIIVVNPDKSGIVELKRRMIVADESKPDMSLLDVVNNQYEIDPKAGSPDWPKEAVTVGLPNDAQERKIGETIIPVKKVIPRLGYLQTRTLRLKGLKEI